MKFTMPKADLVKLLSAASKALPKTTSLPIIDNLYLDITGSQLVAKGTDLLVEVVSKVDFDTTDTLSVLLPPNFLPIVGSLPTPDVNLEFSMNGDNGKVVIKGGNSVFTLFVKNVEDYPVITEKPPVGESLSFTEKEIREILEQAVVCVSIDESRPVFQCVALLFNKDNLKIVSSDTYRLSHRVEDKPWNEERVMLLPGKSIKDLLRMVGNGDDAVEVYPLDDRMVFRSNGLYFSARTTTEKFPDISGVIPGKHKTQVVLPARELEAMAHRVAIVAGGRNHSIRLKLEAESLELFAKSETGKATESLIPMRREGEDVELYANVFFLLDALKVIPGKNVRLCMNGPTGPIVVYDDDSTDWLSLILPVKQD